MNQVSVLKRYYDVQQKKILEEGEIHSGYGALTADAKKHACASGLLKKGTTVTCKQTTIVPVRIRPAAS